MEKKEIHFNQKHVDESWKDQISREKEDNQSAREPSSQFSALASSLGLQALMHLGLIAEDESRPPKPNIAAARETIELLLMLKEKTKNNLTSEESRLLGSLITDLQLKFVQLQK